MDWIYSSGLALLMIAYTDIMKFRGLARNFIAICEIIFGISWLVFFIWGFFIFSWTVPVFYTIGAMVALSFVRALIINGPGLNSYILGGVGLFLCLTSLS